jgi:hypothetical protein
VDVAEDLESIPDGLLVEAVRATESIYFYRAVDRATVLHPLQCPL